LLNPDITHNAGIASSLGGCRLSGSYPLYPFLGLVRRPGFFVLHAAQHCENKQGKSPPKFDKENNMATRMKQLGAMTLVALVAGSCLLITSAKADVAAAEATFKAKCAGCHGADGKGKEALKTQDLGSPDVQKMSDADLSGIITNGKGKMPPYKSMSADQVKDMVSYIRSLAKK
jgi:mono/diheme cytochrome c family protein